MLNAQINGISASKITAFSYDPIDKGTIEFEPNFATALSSSLWTDSGERIALDSTIVTSSLGWRIAYGVNEKLEVAMFALSNLENISFASKMILLEQDKLGLAAMIGLNIPLGERTFLKNQPTFENGSTFGIGMISTHTINEKWSVDVNVQYQNNFRKVDDLEQDKFFINVDVGLVEFDEKVTFVLGGGYFVFLSQDNNYVFNLIPGIAWDAGERFSFALNSSHDLFGRNNERVHGYNLAITTTFD